MSTPAVKRLNRYNITRATWRGIKLEIRHCPTWSKAAGIDHIEIVANDSQKLPITDTGYRSMFIMPEYIAEKGTAHNYVMAWLDHEAKSKTWRQFEKDAQQLSLF